MWDDDASDAPLRCCTRCRASYRKDVAFCPSDGGEIVEVTSDPLLGAEIGHYTIDALIGEGAMGRVYRAHHSTLSDKVFALKVLIGDLASMQAMRMRFVNEAKSAGRLSHPNVASVVDFGSHEGLIYLVMELVNGKAMSELIDQGPLDPERVARLGRGIAEGLRHAHELGLIHRDLKPENVIVTADARGGELPKVVDFGIAVSLEQSDARLTATGIAMGTPAYVAPEQVSTKDLDARADQYALGVTLYEALTGGSLPFSGDPVGVVTEKVANSAPPLATKMPEDRVAPPGLARIVEKMIERRPRDRFEDLGEVIAALDRWMEHRPGETENVPVPRPRRRRRRGLVVVTGVTAAVAASALAFALTRPTAQPRSPVPEAVAAPAPPRPVPPRPALSPPTAKVAPIVTPADEPVPTPAPTSVLAEQTVARDTAVAAIDAVAPRGRRAPGRPDRNKKTEKIEVVANVPVPPEKDPVVAVPDPVRTPPPPVPTPLQARLLGVDVQGSLSQAVIQRAVERVRPAIERCTSDGAPHTVQVKFTIDESRRAHGLRSSGSTSAATCLVGALGGVRTEAAPDTGDAEVVVRIAFGSHS